MYRYSIFDHECCGSSLYVFDLRVSGELHEFYLTKKPKKNLLSISNGYKLKPSNGNLVCKTPTLTLHTFAQTNMQNQYAEPIYIYSASVYGFSGKRSGWRVSVAPCQMPPLHNPCPQRLYQRLSRRPFDAPFDAPF